MSNSLGTVFRVTSFGESHGRCVGVVVDGCPAGLKVNLSLLQAEMDRRRPGQSEVTTSRTEEDHVELLSGVNHQYTTGAPICMLVWNRDADSSRYLSSSTPRPGHADYAARLRYGGFNDHRGGGRFSGRITAGFVMAGALAKQLLQVVLGVEVLAFTSSIGGVRAPKVSIPEIRAMTETNPVRCPHTETANRMLELIEATKASGDSIGGEVECVALGLPPGVGQPIFDTLEGEIAKALFAVPAVKAVGFGVGNMIAEMKGSDANDAFALVNGRIVTASNNSGGILGGISTGMPIVCHASFKPTPSIALSQRTVNLEAMTETEIAVEGRHDPCVVPRAVPVVEAMVALVLADHSLRRGLIPLVLEEKR